MRDLPCVNAIQSICDYMCECPSQSEEAIGSFGTGIIDGCQLPCGHLELGPGPLQEQPCAEPSLQPHDFFSLFRRLYLFKKFLLFIHTFACIAHITVCSFNVSHAARCRWKKNSESWDLVKQLTMLGGRFSCSAPRAYTAKCFPCWIFYMIYNIFPC